MSTTDQSPARAAAITSGPTGTVHSLPPSTSRSQASRLRATTASLLSLTRARYPVGPPDCTGLSGSLGRRTEDHAAARGLRVQLAVGSGQAGLGERGARPQVQHGALADQRPGGGCDRPEELHAEIEAGVI